MTPDQLIRSRAGAARTLSECVAEFEAAQTDMERAGALGGILGAAASAIACEFGHELAQHALTRVAVRLKASAQ
ncbi:MAG TPA: hypothetical protein VMU59_04215 [Caulobacteraceae bacterium]|nr:hypothetical protein [Caulobacteraceae bacterium]